MHLSLSSVTSRGVETLDVGNEKELTTHPLTLSHRLMLSALRGHEHSSNVSQTFLL